MFSFDTTTLLTEAASIFNALAPIAFLIGGILLGIGFFRFLLKELRSIF